MTLDADSYRNLAIVPPPPQGEGIEAVEAGALPAPAPAPVPTGPPPPLPPTPDSAEEEAPRRRAALWLLPLLLVLGGAAAVAAYLATRDGGAGAGGAMASEGAPEDGGGAAAVGDERAAPSAEAAPSPTPTASWATALPWVEPPADATLTPLAADRSCDLAEDRAVPVSAPGYDELLAAANDANVTAVEKQLSGGASALDGDSAVVVSYNEDGTAGAVWALGRTDGTWEQTAVVLSVAPAGCSVAHGGGRHGRLRHLGGHRRM